MEGGMAKKQRTRATAETMAGKQREISVSEFFAKNRHLLGFDNPRKALLTTVKEAVDNALDACEEAGILPDIEVRIEELIAPPSPSKPGRYRVTITDNGPGIVRKQVENIFGKLLYGSKFHRLKMSRGQQGIGISAAGMYGLMTTGRPMVITTKPKKNKPAHHLELAMDTTRNKPEVTVDVETDEFFPTSSGTGTRVVIELEGRYVRGKASVEAYLEQTAIANPHAHIVFVPPEKANEDPTLEAGREGTDPAGMAGSPADIVRTTEHEDRIVYPRTVEELPPETVEIKPHPYGVELGNFLRMLKATSEKQLAGFFKREFCRVTPAVIKEITKKASTKDKTITGQTYVSTIDHAAAERIYKAMQEAKLRSPPTDCLAPIGVRTLLAGLLKGVKAEFYAASTRNPAVYRGNPFQIEAAIAYGGDLPADQPARVIRFANRVPLLYQQSACCAFKSVTETSWKNYGLSQPRGSGPVGPLVVMIHMASVWVPFTSESKEAIADYDEIRKEMKLALQECGRKLGTYVRRRQKMKREGERREVFERYIGEIAKSCHALVGVDTATIYEALMKQARRRTEIADAQLDEDGRIIRDDSNGKLDDDDGVIIVRDDGPGPEETMGTSRGGLKGPAKSNDGNEHSSPNTGAKSRNKTRRGSRSSGAKKKGLTKKPVSGKSPRPKPAEATPTSLAGTASLKRGGIKNRGMPKPRVKLGAKTEKGLFG
ncbi:MAG: DNA topoisomerase VI subunit B [Planctomycetota bacterium]|nr:MAG: DNA topoisomerase VI subunit B [Planctomycetota bacterium]